MPEITISQCPLFCNLSPDECRIVSEIMTQHHYSEGEDILSEGAETSNLHLLTTGTCVVTKKMGQADPHELDVLKPGAVFGEISFFYPGPHSATVKATSAATTFVLSDDGFQTLQNERPAAALKITLHATSTLAARLRRMDEWTCELVNKEKPELAHHEWHEFRSQLYSEWNF